MRSLRLAIFGHLIRFWYNLIGVVCSVIFAIAFLGIWYYFETIWR